MLYNRLEVNMDLVKKHWGAEDIVSFHEYVLSFSKGPEKGEWERRIVNTSLPCIAVPSPVVKKIISQISKGNFLEFLDKLDISNYSEQAICGGLICKIKDYSLMKKYLDEYLSKVDNWAAVDTLKFNINNFNKKEYFSLAETYVKSPHTFVRRCGLIILFKFIVDDSYINKIFDIMNSLSTETEYYVNMANAWLFAECFTKQRDKTLKFLKTHNMNDFTINKGVQKCRDSYRISAEDKQMLLQYKRKKNAAK